MLVSSINKSPTKMYGSFLPEGIVAEAIKPIWSTINSKALQASAILMILIRLPCTSAVISISLLVNNNGCMCGENNLKSQVVACAVPRVSNASGWCKGLSKNK